MIAHPPVRQQSSHNPIPAGHAQPARRLDSSAPADGEWVPGINGFALLRALAVFGLVASLLFAAAVIGWLALPGWVVLVLAGLWLLRCAARRVGSRLRPGGSPGSAVERRSR